MEQEEHDDWMILLLFFTFAPREDVRARSLRRLLRNVPRGGGRAPGLGFSLRGGPNCQYKLGPRWGSLKLNLTTFFLGFTFEGSLEPAAVSLSSLPRPFTSNPCASSASFTS